MENDAVDGYDFIVVQPKDVANLDLLALDDGYLPKV